MAKLGERLIAALGGVTRDELTTARTRAYESGFSDGNDDPVSGDLKSFGYKRATSGSVRDLGGLDYGQVMNTAWRVFLMSPVAKRYIQLKRDYELGRGIQANVAAAQDEQGESVENPLQVIIDDFWAHNKLDERLKQFASQLHLLGEQVYPVFVRQIDGRVSLGYIDPSEIHKVIQHPDNCLERWAVVLKEQKADSEETWKRDQKRKRVFRIVREAEPVPGPLGEAVPQPHEGKLVMHDQAQLEQWEVEMLKAYQLDAYTGTCFYFHRNALSNQPRGYTDLLQVADWIDQDETVLFDLADRENIAGHFVTDVTVEGADDSAIKQRAGEVRANPPKKGSINFHNDRETWQMQAPDLKQTGSVETHRALLTHVMGGQGLPNHWYGYGDETNRATAQAQGDPTWRTMETDQDGVRDMVLMMLGFVRDQAAIAGVQVDPEAEITLTMPEMTAKDVVAVSSAMSQVSLALAQAVDAGWMTNETAAEVWAKVVAEIGVEIDPAEEMEKIQAEGDGQALGQQDDMNSWLSMHGYSMDTGPQPVPAAFGMTDAND